jgi:NTP pyrophosphatase (non-canonical NTP hydrolase)
VTAERLTPPSINEPAHTPGATLKLSAVLCGSFRRDVDGLARVYSQLSAAYEVLSPTSLAFVNPGHEFVRLAAEVDEAVGSIERRHLLAITKSDFVWLHAPDGYVGSSASLEIGHAHALGIPVFSTLPPTDLTLASLIHVVDGPEDVARSLSAEPGHGLQALQRYYGRVAARRGWADESAQDTLLLLTEELGELARAIRKSSGLARDGDWTQDPVETELADVQLYLVHLANVLGVDLANAVSDKERTNAQRVARRPSAA